MSTHCFLHRESLVAKTIREELQFILNGIIKMVNYIKSKPLKSLLFAKICEEMGSQYLNLIPHTGIS
jgi:hypothetical protein